MALASASLIAQSRSRNHHGALVHHTLHSNLVSGDYHMSRHVEIDGGTSRIDAEDSDVSFAHTSSQLWTVLTVLLWQDDFDDEEDEEDENDDEETAGGDDEEGDTDNSDEDDENA